MAECALPGWSMWRFRWCLFGRSHYQSLGIPLDHYLCADSDERHYLHFLLREFREPRGLNFFFNNFQANSLTLLVVGQALEGVPWGFFIANSPAYASEIVPLALRGACTATLQMSWSIGSIIVAGATYGYNKRSDEWAWRVPLALQWLFPVSLRNPIFKIHPKLTGPDPSSHSRLSRPRVPLVAHPPRTQS